MDEMPELIDSSLNQRVHQGKAWVDVKIYRCADEPDWLLEVVDQHGTSLVWDDRFSTETAALDEARLQVDEVGIERMMAAE